MVQNCRLRKICSHLIQPSLTEANSGTLRWTRRTPGGDVPPARSSHSLTALPSGVWAVFGGEDSPRNAFDAHVYLLKAGSTTWQRCAAPAPTGPILGHGAAAIGKTLYVFGGRMGGTNDFDTTGKAGESESGELLSFDTETGTWKHFPRTDTKWPEPRSFPAACASDEEFFIFGGVGAKGRVNDLWSFRPSTSSWTCLHPGGGEAEAPVARGGAAICATRDAKTGAVKVVLLFGFNGQQRGDIAIFEGGSWRQMPHEQLQGDVPTPRSVFGSAFGFGSEEVFLFGGERVPSDKGHAGAGEFTRDLYALNLQTMQWRQPKLAGELPIARGWTGMAGAPAAPGAAGKTAALLFGGLDQGNTRLGDFWELEVA